MKKLFSKFKNGRQDTLPESNNQAASSRTSPINPPTHHEVLWYRYHHGTNLGSIFCLEQWLTPSLYPPSTTGPEISAVEASINLHGITQTKQKWEAHWGNALSDSDFSWLANTAHCTSLRLPLGYYCLGKDFCRGTPYGEVQEVYAGAWTAIKKLVERAKQWEIGVLLDLHALPGGVNNDAHGGVIGNAEFWGSNGKKHRELARQACVFIAQEVKNSPSLEGVTGLQIVNEAAWGAGIQGMYGWYDDVLKSIASVNDSLPIYVSDAWDLGQCLDWASKRKGVNPVIVDTHKYYTFSQSDRSQSPSQIIERIPTELGELMQRKGEVANSSPCEVIVGEYSCVLDEQTWSKVGPEERPTLVKEFGQVQNKRWEQTSGGAYFWTFQDGMGEWSFIQQTNQGNITAPRWLQFSNDGVKERAQRAQGHAAALAKSAIYSHVQYWNATCPEQAFEHERYADGWKLGFSDALAFFTMRVTGHRNSERQALGADKIGFKELWVKRRLVQSGQTGPFVWEWEQGIRAGMAAFELEIGT